MSNEPNLDDLSIDGQPDEQSPIEVFAQPKKHLYRRTLIVSGILLIVGLIVIGAWYYWQQSSQKTANDSNVSPTKNQQAEEPITDPLLLKFITPTTGEKWFDKPTPLPKQGWLMDDSGATYYEVGSRGDNKIYVVTSDMYSMGTTAYIFEKSPEGKVVIIANPTTTSSMVRESLISTNDMCSPRVSKVDTDIHYDSLSLPKSIKLANGETVDLPEYSLIGSPTIDPESQQKFTSETKVEQYGYGSLFRSENSAVDTKLTNISYRMQLPFTSITLAYRPNNESIAKYTWANGRDNTTVDSFTGKSSIDTLKPIARGCGYFGVSVTRSDSLKQSDLVEVGKTDTGRLVYQVKDQANMLVKKAYDEYTSSAKNNSQTAVALSEFLEDHALVVIKNQADEMLVYVRNSYAPSYGCAKPVVYLYPTSKTAVDVSVGANVKISDPLYPSGGWKSVIAYPNGQLNYEGKNYTSLFWEGNGYGQYPTITNGTVVARQDALAVIKRQLREQGLNEREFADFLEFWSDKIPNKPYVRLTWFTTSQLNSLAPLRISPKPDTLIRVFLDMEGYDKKIDIPAQRLTALPRIGFTVVEWGGLSGAIRH